MTLLVAQPRQPDVAAQKAALKKLEFLAGEWEGHARISCGPGEPLAVRQTEEVQMKLDGLALLAMPFDEAAGQGPPHNEAERKGECTEADEVIIGSAPPRKTMEMTVRRVP